ncbi:hypothetical protein HY750_01270 [Candidatus Kuenenbacteria bacterium]|nr:hypothetical protein [Candidatus Kuenenbacteria bacterium]
MKNFIVEISHTEYGKIEINAKNKQEAEKMALENIDDVNWGNDETDIISIEEVKTNTK